MLKRMKVSFLVIAGIALFFGTIWMMGVSFGEVVQAQEPSIDETVKQEAVFNEVDFTAPAMSDTIDEAVFSEMDITVPALPVDTESEEILSLEPTADTVDDAVLPAVPADTGSELTRWESTHLKSAADSVDAAPATAVKPGSELSMWERLNFTSLLSGN